MDHCDKCSFKDMCGILKPIDKLLSEVTSNQFFLYDDEARDELRTFLAKGCMRYIEVKGGD